MVHGVVLGVVHGDALGVLHCGAKVLHCGAKVWCMVACKVWCGA